VGATRLADTIGGIVAFAVEEAGTEGEFDNTVLLSIVGLSAVASVDDNDERDRGKGEGTVGMLAIGGRIGDCACDKVDVPDDERSLCVLRTL
jgi:hypothetical protein